MKLTEQICNWIKEQVTKANSQGIVVGISGGIDSAVVAALSKKSLGDKVLGLIMPCQSNHIDEEYGLLIASKLNLKIERVLLDSVYNSFLKILPPVGDITSGRGSTKLSLANIKPRLRMITLYYFANSLNYLVAGTGNRSEIMVGYFTKYGDGGTDILPIGGLLKTEVRELARELDIPNEIIDRTPTAGLWHGQTDEGELGMRYEDLDNIISGKTIEIPSIDLTARVQGLIDASQHKRELPAIFTPN